MNSAEHVSPLTCVFVLHFIAKSSHILVVYGSAVKDKTEEIFAWHGRYDEYLGIISEFKLEHIRVYTDGSHI